MSLNLIDQAAQRKRIDDLLANPVESAKELEQFRLKLASRDAEIESLRQQLATAQSRQCTSPWEDSPPCRGIQKVLDQLADHIKREVMLRDALKHMRSEYERYACDACDEADEALAATADLKGVRLCHEKPTAWCQDVIYEMAPEFAFSWVETQLHDFPLYRVWEQKK